MQTYTLTAEQLQTILAAILDTTVDADDSREQGQLNPTITASSYRKLKSAHALLLQIVLNQRDYADPTPSN